MLVHQVPVVLKNGSINYKGYTNKFASNYVARKLFLKFRENNKFNIGLLLNGMKGISGLQSICGDVFEEASHQAISECLGLGDLIDLKSKGRRKLRKNVWKGFAEILRFEKNNMSDLEKFSLATYAYPMTSNFESLDSFAILKQNVFIPKSKGGCLVGFQMTIRDSHPVNYGGIIDVRNKVLTLIEDEKLKDEIENAPFYLVFVLDSEKPEYLKEQILKGDEPNDFVISQFAITIPDVINQTKTKIHTEWGITNDQM